MTLPSLPFVAIVPVRFASQRFPGKPLIDLAGKPMVIRVAEQAQKSGAERVVVATDDARIASVVADHGFACVMTRTDHATGTDRLAEAVAQLGLAAESIVVNVQGDEPLIAPTLIREVAQQLHRDAGAAMATAAHPLHDSSQFLNRNIVKVVINAQQRALYFSRAPIPWARDALAESSENCGENNAGMSPVLPNDLPALRHIGLYAYRVNFLQAYPHLPPCQLEHYEALEQLRALWHGYAISVYLAEPTTASGIDTPADVAAVLACLAAQR